MRFWWLARTQVNTTSELALSGVKAWRHSGLSVPRNPLTGLRLGRDLFVHGVSPAIGWAAGADRHPDAPAVVDEYGLRLTQREAEERPGAPRAPCGSGDSMATIPPRSWGATVPDSPWLLRLWPAPAPTWSI